MKNTLLKTLFTLLVTAQFYAVSAYATYDDNGGFHPDTLVQRMDGTQSTIDSIFVTRKVQGLNEMSSRWAYLPEERVVSANGKTTYGETITMVRILLNTTLEIKCTQGQYFINRVGALVRADSLKPGDQLVGASGQPVTIQQVSTLPYDGLVSKLEITAPDNRIYQHLIIVNGVYALDSKLVN